MTSHPKMQTLRAEVALSVAGCFAPSCCPHLGLHSVMVLANGLETKATSILKVSMVRVYGTLNFSKSVMIRFSLVGKKRIVLV